MSLILQCKTALTAVCRRTLPGLLLGMLPLPLYALSLGNEAVLSALGDPVEVEIDVLQWEDVDLERVQISLANPAEYDSFRLTRLPVLEQLDFNIVGPNSRGEVKVLVSTREPVSEPFVELLLVLRWPGGSLLREYVLLFDLPERNALVSVAETEESQPIAEPEAPATPEVVQAEPVAEPIAEVLPSEPVAQPVRRLVTEAPQPAPETAPPALPVTELPQAEPDMEPAPRDQGAIVVESAAPAAAPPPSGRRLYQVREGDGLWSIAQQFLPAGAGENIYQMLLSLHDLNRAAFINGNISLLKAGALLQIPDVADIAAVAPDSAEARFEERWDEGTRRFQTALRGEPLPAFSEQYDSERVEAGPEATREQRRPGEESGRVQPAPGGLLSPATTPVLMASEEAQDIPAPAVQITSTETLALPVPGVSASAGEASSPAAARSTNTWLERVDGTARDLQQLLQSRQLQIAELEQQLVEMRQRMREAQALTARVNLALEEALARQRAQQAQTGQATLLGSLILLLALGLIAAMVMLLKLTAQLRSRQRESGMDSGGPAAARVGEAPPAPTTHAPGTAQGYGMVVEELREPTLTSEAADAAVQEHDAAQQELLELIAPLAPDAAPAASRKAGVQGERD